MNALVVLAILTCIIYSLLIDATFLKIYLILVVIYYFISELIFKEQDKLWKRRKITISSWGHPSDPTCYLPIDYDVTDTLDFISKMSGEHRITLTHVVAKAIGMGFNSAPHLLGRIAFGNFRHFKQADVSVLAAVEGGKDLVPVTIRGPHAKKIEEIADEINAKANKARKGEDQEHKKNTEAFNFLPSFLTGALMDVMVYITQNLGWSVPLLGIKGDSLAPIVLTNVGSLGLYSGFAPIPPTA